MKKLFPICLLLLLLLLPATAHAMDFTPEEGANSRLSERLQEVKLENKSLRCTSADYAQLKQILGAEQIEATLNAAKRLKQSEKGCKRPQRSIDRGV